MDNNADYHKLIHNYYHSWFRYHPEVAVEMGVNDYAGCLTPYDDDDIGALCVLQEKLINNIDEFNTENCSTAQKLDLDIMRGAAVLELTALIEHDWRHRDPGCYLPINAIYQLTVRPVADLQQALSARLKAIPGYLRGARAHLTKRVEIIPDLWLQSALQEADAGIHYFRSLRQHPNFIRYKLEHALDEACHALTDYIQFLKHNIADHCRGEFACGEEYFNQLLQNHHFMDIDANKLFEFGEQLFSETQQALKAVCKKLQGNENIAALIEEIQSHHPAKENLLEVYRQQIKAAKDFISLHDLVTIPSTEKLNVVETPIFLQHKIPFAAYEPPLPNDAKQQAYYYVTPAKDDEAMGEHNNISLQHTSVHEAFPGHHLQFVTANLNPEASTLPRLINASATCYEGWALYCEELMVEQAYIDDPRSEFVLLKDRLWRALRIMIDVEIHTRGMSIDHAAKRMIEHLGFTEQQAKADLTWYSYAPTVPMGYATGWALIMATRKRLKSVETDFSLKHFHDRLLSNGSIAIALVLESSFGKPLWKSVKRSVFS